MLPNITLDAFEPFRSTETNWRGIPIEFLNVFRTLVPASQFKYSFSGYDPKGRPSYLKLYAKTFAVSFRDTEVARASAKRETKQALRKIRTLLRQHNISLREVA